MNIKKLHGTDGQTGFASLVIALVLVIVLSLITVGFAELMRKEQRSALDKHLSSQAYYAAEAGINDAAKALIAGFSKTKTICGPLAGSDITPGASYLRGTDRNKLGKEADNVSYTCLLIDPTPQTLEYGPSSETQSKIVEITGVEASNPAQTAIIDHLTISWEDPERRADFAGNDRTFSPMSGSGAWSSNTGVIRIGLTPLVSGGINRAYLKANTYHAFLYPNAYGSASTNANSYPSYEFDSGTGDKGGVILNGNCNANSRPRYCNATINMGSAAQANFLLSLRWIYSTSRITISAYDSSNQPLRIKNAQTLVDSTGKAQDVLRRVQVRIPARNNYDHTDYGLEIMGGICKQMQIFPDTASRGTCN